MIKLVILAIIFAIIIIYLKSINSELSLLASVGAGLLLTYFSLDYITNAFEFFNKLIEYAKIDSQLILIIFKITAIGYLVEFSAGIIKDFGLQSLSDKLIFVGKIIILSISMPIVYAVFNLIIGISI